MTRATMAVDTGSDGRRLERRPQAGRPVSGLVAVVTVSGVVAWWGCGGAEHEVLDRFFTAVEYQDSNMVAAVSLVAFPEEEVGSWRVLEVGPTGTEGFRLTELRERARKAKQARDEQFSRFSDFRRANYDDLVRIQDQLDRNPETTFSGRFAELRAEWDAYVEERRTLERNFRELERAMEAERKPARESVLTSDEIDRFDGDVLTREVLVGVEAPGARNSEETVYLFTLRKYNLTRRQDAFTPPSRWIITGIEKQGS